MAMLNPMFSGSHGGGFFSAGCGSEKGPPALTTRKQPGLPETANHPSARVNACLETLARLLARQAVRELMATPSDTVETQAPLPPVDEQS